MVRPGLLLPLIAACAAAACAGRGAAPAPSFRPPAALAAGVPAERSSCERARGEAERLLERGRDVDVHLLALLAAVVCPERDGRIELLDAIALARLDEGERARAVLRSLERDPAVAAAARVILSWSHWREGDAGAFDRSLAQLGAEPRRRLALLAHIGDEEAFRRGASALELARQRSALRAHDRYLEARSKHPWLAGTLSAVLPGAGQVYAGSWEAGAVAFVLNGVTIGSAVELVREDLYVSASLVGLVASIFYVGSILNAADLARRHDDRRSEGALERINQVLVPEVYGLEAP